MKKLIFSLIAMASLPLLAHAQDDLYFTPTKADVDKAKAQRAEETKLLERANPNTSYEKTYYSGISKTDDQYNRRRHRDSKPYEVSQADIIGTDSLASDIIDFMSGTGYPNDSVRVDTVVKYVILDDDDYCYSRMMSRFEDYMWMRGYSPLWWHRPLGWYCGWYGPWAYDPWFDPYWDYPFYWDYCYGGLWDPYWGYGGYWGGWYDPWFSPWYYGGYPYAYYGGGAYHGGHHGDGFGGGGHGGNVMSHSVRHLNGDMAHNVGGSSASSSRHNTSAYSIATRNGGTASSTGHNYNHNYSNSRSGWVRNTERSSNFNSSFNGSRSASYSGGGFSGGSSRSSGGGFGGGGSHGGGGFGSHGGGRR